MVVVVVVSFASSFEPVARTRLPSHHEYISSLTSRRRAFCLCTHPSLWPRALERMRYGASARFCCWCFLLAWVVVMMFECTCCSSRGLMPIRKTAPRAQSTPARTDFCDVCIVYVHMRRRRRSLCTCTNFELNWWWENKSYVTLCVHIQLGVHTMHKNMETVLLYFSLRVWCILYTRVYMIFVRIRHTVRIYRYDMRTYTKAFMYIYIRVFVILLVR